MEQQTQNTFETRNVMIGGYQILPLRTGFFALDGGAMFGTVPRVLWEKTNPPDSFHRIQMQARVLLLKGHGRLILIDTGMGSDFVLKYGEHLGSKFEQMYGVESGGGLVGELSRLDISPDDITDVILTHLHFDHAGGATRANGSQLSPTFPKARYYLQKENLTTARTPNLRERASYLTPNLQPLVEADCLTLLEGNYENLLPGVSVEVTHGHTRGQQIVVVKDSHSGLVYAADLIPMRPHVRLAWIMGYDLEPLVIIEEKRNLLRRASENSWYIFFEHDPEVDAAHVESQKEDFVVKKSFRFLS